MEVIHVPVMLREVMEMLSPKEGGIYIDATLGLGGHAEEILKNVKACTLIGIDRDEEAIKIAEERLRRFRLSHSMYFMKESFSSMSKAAEALGYRAVDGILLDLGVSTLQLKAGGKGFSFLKDEPLDMRMDKSQRLTAGEVVNKYPEKRLADIIYQYGEERFSRRIARAIVNTRNKKPITSCVELAEIITKAVPGRGKTHPATRTFQALRIEVNKELEELERAINSGVDTLRAGGRLCVLSYHSLEDRLVKNAFKRLASEGLFRIITKKPLTPCREEILSNPSSRSAKLRAGERL